MEDAPNDKKKYLGDRKNINNKKYKVAKSAETSVAGIVFQYYTATPSKLSTIL